MDTPPQQPHTSYYKLPDMPPKPARPRYRRNLVIVALAVIVSAVFISWLFWPPPTPPLTPAQVSATAEARQFATAQVARQETRVSAQSTSTAETQASSTVQAQAEATRQAYAAKTATAVARATAQAPPTLTAQAKQFEEEQSRALATTRSLDRQATQAFGPKNGSLQHEADGSPACADTDLALHGFVATARFYNPYTASQHPWDYGIAFTNVGDDTTYSASVRSIGDRAIKLQGQGFYIMDRDDTDLLDLSDTGANTIKLYLSDDVLYFFLNGHYVTTLELDALNLNQTHATLHSPMPCANLHKGDSLDGASTRYQDFTVWSLP